MSTIKVMFDDGSWVVCRRPWWFTFREQFGFRQYIVVNSSTAGLKEGAHITVAGFKPKYYEAIRRQG